MQDLNDKVTGDSLQASEWNQIPSEIQNVIESLGIALSGGDLNQLGKAISGYVANGIFYTDSGVADAYVLTPIGLKKMAPAYTDGMRIVFYVGNTNTGATTVNVGALGVKSIKTMTDAALPAGTLVTGNLYEAIYSTSAGWFRLVTTADAAMPLAGGIFTGGVREKKVAMAANDVDISAGNYFTKTISGTTALTVSNVPATGSAASFILDLTNGGSAVITWWSGMKWAGGTAPSLTAAGRDVLGFFTHDGGTTWTGLVLGKDVK